MKYSLRKKIDTWIKLRTNSCIRDTPVKMNFHSFMCCLYLFTFCVWLVKSQFCSFTQRLVCKNDVGVHILMGLALVFNHNPNWKVQQQPELRLMASLSFLSSCQMPEAGTLLRMPIITLATTGESRHSLMIEEMLTEGGEIISHHWCQPVFFF